jgi:hypothetical protein
MILNESPHDDSRKLSWFFMEHTMAYLKGAFVSKQGTSLEKYK